ncbi:PREDICTED: gastrin [Elephantulus edwardii]|uniref:gastrin n=1 Tax=Elephantulus edwardii TaxID=28737 RepID=UPI0003F0D886|nr:PREDICTED: gastrin [Elephantulus edwardii]
MLRLCVYVVTLVLALATFSEASRKPHSQMQDESSSPVASRGLELHWPDQLGPASRHQRQLGPQGPSHFAGELSKKQGPWMEEEEEAYGWMDFGRRAAEEDKRR